MECRLRLIWGDKVNDIQQPVNVYGWTKYYKYGSLGFIRDGFGFRDTNGNITWYEGYYQPEDTDESLFYTSDNYTESFVINYGNNTELKDMPK